MHESAKSKNLSKNINDDLIYRKATLKDLGSIVSLLVEDELGQNRELQTEQLDQRYIEAFYQISADENQYLMVVDYKGEIVATCQLTIIPSLTFIGSARIQIEAVRVSKKYRGQKMGEWMITAAISYGKSKGALIAQLTTNKKRQKARKFYEKLGFEASHEGMKKYL